MAFTPHKYSKDNPSTVFVDSLNSQKASFQYNLNDGNWSIVKYKKDGRVLLTNGTDFQSAKVVYNLPKEE